MRFAASWGALELLIGEVGYCLRHDAESRRRLSPAHSAGQRYHYQLLFVFVGRENDGQLWTLAGVQVHLIEAVLDVVLREEGRAVFQISMLGEVQHSSKRASKLHGLRWCVRQCGVVDRVSRVVA